MAVVEDLFAVDGQGRDGPRASPRGDDQVRARDLGRLTDRLAVHRLRRLDGDAALAEQRRLAHEHVDLVLLHQEADALVHLVGYAARALDDGREVELDVAQPRGRAVAGGGRDKPVVGEVAHLAGQFGTLEQRLRRDAADVEAYAAELVLLDDGRAEAELVRADGGFVAAGAGADHDDVVRGVCHGSESGG